MSRLLARGVVVSPLPNLQAADKKTISHALHDDTFIGLEEDWTGFFDDVMSYFRSTPWHQHDKVISYRPGPNTAASIFEEHVPCGDEANVQSRFIQNVSQHMNAICKAAKVDKAIGDYKSCASNPVTGVPDIIVRTRAGELKVVGEMKVWWISEHNLELGKAGKTTSRKRLLGQIGKYMKEAGTRYGFLSNYNETVFLRQDFFQGQWRLFVSDVVNHNTRSEPNHPTLRQCFWYLLNRPATEYHITNNTPLSQWVQNSY